MTEFLSNALAKGNAVADVPLHIKRLIFVFIESTHIRIGQLVNALNVDGCAVEHNRYQLSRITVSGRGGGALAVGLRNIQHSFQVEINADCSIFLGILIRIKDNKGLGAFIDLNALSRPIVKFLDLTCLRELLIHQQRIVRRVPIHTALHIKVGSEFFRRLHHFQSGVVEQLVNSFFLRLFLGGVFLRRKSRRSCATALLTLKIVGHIFLPLF